MNNNKNHLRVFRILQPNKKPLGEFGILQPLPKGKKAMLLAEETLKMIIALLGIVVLVYLLVSIYFNSSTNKNKQHAEAVLEEIVLIVNNIQMQTGEIPNPTPFRWWVFGFVGNEKKPNSCAGQNCLCICGKALPVIGNQEKKCDEKGVCEVIENLGSFEDFKIQKGIFSINVIKSEEGKVIIRGR